ncbi:hypothetical protein [Pelagibacterium luteolum]|uniref:Uncharacterized protein n=1 Tax=Pelagibacterium luteolum TaxID=440168 RepID=A0A1G7TJU4_9HYPH|nr:hypothetical protein [Pelagibacterium luteolum]SDG35481.1 hypothetical protein SAMN04487974_102169 [Pelagibacterium luteolum]
MTAVTELSRTGNDRIKPGGNLSPFDAIVLEIDDLYAEAANWADGSDIESQEQCDALDTLDKALLALDKKREALRKEEVKPLDEAKKAIQALHKPVEAKVARARDVLNGPRSKWKAKIEAKKRARAEQAAREAEEERAKALAAMQSSSGDLEARERAEEQLAHAKEAEAFAKREDKRANTGNGLRTYHRAQLTDLRAAIGHYWKSQTDAFEALVCDLAAKDVRAGKRDIPGFTVIEEKKAL